MKNFRIPFAASYCALILTMGACATLRQHSAAVSLIVSQATMRYIEQAKPDERAARAARVLAVASDIEKVASGEPVTIAQLAQLALIAIPSNLAPSDRALAISIVSIAAQELQNKVGENVLSADQLVTVKEVVSAVASAASIYVSR